MKKNQKGFTLAELLVVVAIIAVLVAIAIPIFTSQLERSKLATDTANVRSLYAELVTAALSDGVSEIKLSKADFTAALTYGSELTFVDEKSITVSRSVGSNVLDVGEGVTFID